MTEESITVRGENITVSRLVWRRYRRPMPVMVEAVFARNPGLADGDFIPIGTLVVLPIPPAAPGPDVISLWD